MILSKIIEEYAARYSSPLRLHNQAIDEERMFPLYVGCNSLEIKKDELFCCIRGEYNDGHAFAGDAVQKGLQLF